MFAAIRFRITAMLAVGTGMVENSMRSHSRLCLTTIGLLVVFACQLATAAEPQWWTNQKRACGLSPSLDYATWARQGYPCRSGNPGNSNNDAAAAAAAAAAAEAARKEAAEAAAAAQRQREVDAAEQNSRGLEAWKGKDWATAADYFQQAVQDDPDDQTYIDNLANAKRKLSDQRENEVGLSNMQQIMRDQTQNQKNSIAISGPLGLDDDRKGEPAIGGKMPDVDGLHLNDDNPSRQTPSSSIQATVLTQYQPKIKNVDEEIHRAQNALRNLIKANGQSEEERLLWTSESEEATIDAQDLSVNLVIDLVGAHVDYWAQKNSEETNIALNELLSRAEQDGQRNSIHVAYRMLIDRRKELERMHNEVHLIGKEYELSGRIANFSVSKDTTLSMESLWDVVSQVGKVDELAGPSKDLMDAAYTIYKQAASLDNLAVIQANQEKTLQAATVLRGYIVRLEAQKRASNGSASR